MPISGAHPRMPRRADRWRQRAFGSWVILGLAMLGSPMAGAAQWDANPPGSPSGFERRFVDRWQPEMTPTAFSASVRPLPGLLVQPFAEPLPEDSLALSPAAIRVSMMAALHGDRTFLMVDKVHGRIILFANGRPIFNRAALTGESLDDRIPPDGWSKRWSEQAGVRYKVTPAGRFTITRARDRALGNLFDIDGLTGRDWAIAIHQVWLGRRSEHRDARLRSAMDQDKHITAGCVDVDPSTLAQLWRLLPGRGMPLYILPTDESLITQLFQPRSAAARLAGPQS
jgi:hypothetical protein